MPDKNLVSMGNGSKYHFAGAGKVIDVGKGGIRGVTDYHLSRFARAGIS